MTQDHIMDKETVREMISELYARVPGNVLSEKDDIKEEYIGTAMYDAPLTGFGSAADPLYERFKDPSVIGPWHMSPCEWLPEAKSIISLFFPMSDEVLKSNREAEVCASDLWAYARIEGQDYLGSFAKALCEAFEEQGIKACAPSVDPRFAKVIGGQGISGYEGINSKTFGSRWSERHTAFVCGLGTFGLSKGIITKRGMAGRFISVIVSAPMEADERPYHDIYEYCIKCGACTRRCPMHAIDLEKGKDHVRCAEWLSIAGMMLSPRYGCGLCQTRVPCERRIPKKQT